MNNVFLMCICGFCLCDAFKIRTSDESLSFGQEHDGDFVPTFSTKCIGKSFGWRQVASIDDPMTH